MNDNQSVSVGPFIKNNVDLYEKDKTVSGVITLFLILFVIGTVIYVSVFVNSLAIPHTYFKYPGAPGMLYSERYSFEWFVIMISIILHVLVVFVIAMLVKFRYNYGCNMIWFFVYFILFVCMILVIAFLGVEYNECNGADAAGNLCNSYKWCCVHYTNPANGCPNVSPCADGTTQSNLSPNFEFMGIMWTNVTLASLHLIFIMFVMFYWVSDGSSDDDEVEYEEYKSLKKPPIEKKINYTNSFTSPGKKVGLRKRRINK